MITQGTNPYFVKELETGYVVIGDNQHFKGYTLFLCKEHKTELFQLDHSQKMKFLEEMSIVAEAVSKAFTEARSMRIRKSTGCSWHRSYYSKPIARLLKSPIGSGTKIRISFLLHFGKQPA